MPDDVQHASSINALRSSFFASAGSCAARYGLSFDDVLIHLWRSREHTGPVNLKLVLYLNDLTHAAACAMQIDRAWADLHDQYERWMTRRFRPQSGPIDALLDVRRFLTRLRLGSDEMRFGFPLSLSVYRGYVPMKVWLANALVESAGNESHVSRALEITGRLARPGQVRPVR